MCRIKICVLVNSVHFRSYLLETLMLFKTENTRFEGTNPQKEFQRTLGFPPCGNYKKRMLAS